MPTNVTLKAEDGVEFHNQLFLPKTAPGGRHPALIFVRPRAAGAARLALASFYHVFYGVNQWLRRRATS